MREPEFLPAWYAKLRRRKRLLKLQACMTLVLAAGLGLWSVLVHYNVGVARASLVQIGGQMAETQVELARLENLLSLQKQLQEQDKVLARLGLHVDSARMLAALKTSMPAEMSLIESNVQIEEKPAVAGSLASAVKLTGTKAKAGETALPELDRRMRVKLLGVTPTDVDVATFLARLQATPYFQQVALSYARDRADNGYLMREFEVTFSLSLNDDTGG